MKRISCLFCVCLLTLSSLRGPALAQDTTLFFEVTGNNLPGPSYLFGTFHLVCPADLLLTEGTKRAFAQTQQLYLELDMDDPTMLADMQKTIMLPTGKNARDYLTIEDYTQLDTYLRTAVGMGLDDLGGFKPLALISVVYTTMLKCEPASYDLTLAQLAAESKKEVLGLEALSTQLSALDRRSISDQFSELVEMVKNPAETQAEFDRLLKAYKTGDLSKLAQAMKTSKHAGDFKEFEDNLLTARNLAWIPIMEKAAKARPTFFAFGAGHLVGDNGVVNLLRQKGYTVLGIFECRMEEVKGGRH